MSSSNIYGASGRDMPKREKRQPVSQRRRQARGSFDKKGSGAPQRRSRNTGSRRFLHLMKQPEYSRKFWTLILSVFALILILLLLWDWFFRYPQPDEGPLQDSYQAVVK